MSPIERAAQALYESWLAEKQVTDEAYLNGPYPHWDGLLDRSKKRWIAKARAVLQAIRDPSDVMKDMGDLALDSDCRLECSGERAWVAMIDAALAEGDVA